MRLPLALLLAVFPWSPGDTPPRPVASAEPSHGGAFAPDSVATSPPPPGPRLEPRVPDVIVLDASPRGDRVAAAEPIVLKLSGPVPEHELVVTLDPPVPLRRKRQGANTWIVEPLPRWRPGRPHRVEVALPRGPQVSFTFRAEVPEPHLVTPGEGKRAILTFDDGPHERRQADHLLDTLREHDARVIFFPTGRWARQRKDWIARALDEGHWVCNHTFSHRNLTKPPITEQDIRFEIENGAGHGQCKLFRPPLMALDDRVERIARELGYDIFLWDVDSRDWQDTPAPDVANWVLGQMRPEAVVLFHLHAKGTMEALPTLLPKLREAGYYLNYALPPDAAADAGVLETLPRPKGPDGGVDGGADG